MVTSLCPLLIVWLCRQLYLEGRRDFIAGHFLCVPLLTGLSYGTRGTLSGPYCGTFVMCPAERDTLTGHFFTSRCPLRHFVEFTGINFFKNFFLTGTHVWKR